jgi:hypothetical protein
VISLFVLEGMCTTITSISFRMYAFPFLGQHHRQTKEFPIHSGSNADGPALGFRQPCKDIGLDDHSIVRIVRLQVPTT